MEFILFVIIFWVFWTLLLLYFKFRNKLISKYKVFFQTSNNYIKIILFFVSFFVLSLWLFDIKISGEKTKGEVKGVDVVFVLDVSKSMNVLDFSDSNYLYSRLDIAKTMISNYISKNTENRYGLVVFAWDAISVCPLTLDHDIFLTFLSGVDYKNLSVQWSNFEKAIDLWVKRFNDEERSKVMILLSDGWDFEDKINHNYIKKATDWKNIFAFVFWVWTQDWWKIPTWRDIFWNITYQKYNNNIVISNLNESNLKQIADNMRWEYIKADSIWEVNKFISNLEREASKVFSNINEKVDATRYLAILSFIFFVLYLFLSLLTFKNKKWN